MGEGLFQGRCSRKYRKMKENKYSPRDPPLNSLLSWLLLFFQGLYPVCFLHYPFHEFIGCWAILNILLVHMHIADHFPLGMVRETCAVAGTDCVDRAHICLKIQKLTRLFFIHPVTCPVLIQPLFPKSPLGHFQMFGNAFDILPGVGWRHGLAAIGTAQAVHLFPYFCVRLNNQLIQSLWILALESC